MMYANRPVNALVVSDDCRPLPPPQAGSGELSSEYRQLYDTYDVGQPLPTNICESYVAGAPYTLLHVSTLSTPPPLLLAGPKSSRYSATGPGGTERCPPSRVHSPETGVVHIPTAPVSLTTHPRRPDSGGVTVKFRPFAGAAQASVPVGVGDTLLDGEGEGVTEGVTPGVASLDSLGVALIVVVALVEGEGV